MKKLSLYLFVNLFFGNICFSIEHHKKLAIENCITRTHPDHYLDELAPDFSASDELGIVHQLSSYKGKKVLLFFFDYHDNDLFSSGFGDTIDHINGINVLYSTFSENNIVVIGACDEIPVRVKNFKKRFNLRYPILPAVGKSIAGFYAATSYGEIIRTTYLIDENGIVLKTIQTYNPWKHLAEMLIFMITQGMLKITPSVTQALTESCNLGSSYLA